MPTIIKGQPTSEDVRRYLADRHEPVILACSLGKDSLAAWTALENDGVKVHPVYFWSVPDLPLIAENVEQIENIF